MNIILILLIIHYASYLIFKPKSKTLNCGIFGWAGKDPKKFNKDKFDKLGMFNESRGRSSCGISYDGEVYIGINSRKLYSDFIIEQIIAPTEFPVVIGHTRQASNGNAVTIDNAHPFAFTNKEDVYQFIGCHNGTLFNTKQLAEKYNIEQTAKKISIVNNVPSETIRTKIDSEILLESIFKNQNFHVLNDYIGAAALAFTNLEEPNILYLFKGASKDYSYSKPDDVSEERPLYVFIENKNSIYFSSLEDPLKTIGGNDDNVIDLECNIVYKIKNGDFINSEKIPISRYNAQQKEKIGNYYNHRGYSEEYYDNLYATNYQEDDLGKKPKEVIKNLLPQKKDMILIDQPHQKSLIEKEGNKINNIYFEEPLISLDEYKSKIYFNKLRFWRNGHMINGVYVWISNYGYKFVGHDQREAETMFWFFVDKHFENGNFYEIKDIEEPNIPFKSEKIINPAFFYFVEGVQIKTFYDYLKVSSDYKKLEKGKFLPHVQLSNVSSHPIINMSLLEKDKDMQFVILDGRLFSGTYAPLGAEKKYTFELGNLVKTEASTYFFQLLNEKANKNDSIKLDKEPIYSNLKLVQDELEEEISKQDSDEELLQNLIKEEEEETELISEIINEDFVGPIQDFQETRKKLFPYNKNSLAIKAINTIDEFMNKINKLIE